MPFDPSCSYVHLTDNGQSTALPGGEAFWSLPSAALDQHGHGWSESEHEFDADWSLSERHPGGDEFVYLLSGGVTMILEIDGERNLVELKDRGARWFLKACGIRPGSWHRRECCL
ncbi:MAG: cupin [Steroidobacterales bacterium]